MKITAERAIAAPVSEVFRAFTDFERASETVSGIESVEMLTEDPVGKGTRFKETRIMFKRPATEILEVTEYHPDRSYTVGCTSCGCEYSTEFLFQPEGQGTRVDMTMTTRPLTFMAKLMSPLGRLMAGPMRKCFEQDLDDLQAGLESNTPASPQA